jgi:hypothetical protein
MILRVPVDFPGCATDHIKAAAIVLLLEFREQHVPGRITHLGRTDLTEAMAANLWQSLGFASSVRAGGSFRKSGDSPWEWSILEHVLA